MICEFLFQNNDKLSAIGLVCKKITKLKVVSKSYDFFNSETRYKKEFISEYKLRIKNES